MFDDDEFISNEDLYQFETTYIFAPREHKRQRLCEVAKNMVIGQKMRYKHDEEELGVNKRQLRTYLNQHGCQIAISEFVDEIIAMSTEVRSLQGAIKALDGCKDRRVHTTKTIDVVEKDLPTLEELSSSLAFTTASQVDITLRGHVLTKEIAKKCMGRMHGGPIPVVRISKTIF